MAAATTDVPDPPFGDQHTCNMIDSRNTRCTSSAENQRLNGEVFVGEVFDGKCPTGT